MIITGTDEPSALEILKATQDNTRKCIRIMQEYMTNHGLKNDGCLIHGKHGPVWWADISKHPKVVAKAQAVKKVRAGR